MGFKSIPHAFWWALVTATTVGYGDVYPTTFFGQITGSVAMIWSLCMLALPVGVIGSTFEQVWKEYDQEKKMERYLRESEHKTVKQILGLIDPLSYSRRLYLEVYHDSQLATKDNDIFIGEVEVELDIQEGSHDPVMMQLTLPLAENREKSDRQVTGTIELNYTWTPAAKPSAAGVMIEGTLAVTLVSAENLVAVDWKGSGITDPYVRMSLYPYSPGPDGKHHAKVHCFETVFDELVPKWYATCSVPFRWHKDGVDAKMKADRLNLSTGARNPSSARGSEFDDGEISRLKSDVSELREAFARADASVQHARARTRAILQGLHRIDNPKDSCDDLQPCLMSHTSSLNNSSGHLSTRAPGTENDSNGRSQLRQASPVALCWTGKAAYCSQDAILMPGAVPEDSEVELPEATVSPAARPPSRHSLN